MLDMQAVSPSGTGPVAPSRDPLAFVNMDYHPGLLLSVPFDRSITEQEDYATSCKHGYDWYFYQVLQCYSLSSRQEVVEYITKNIMPAHNMVMRGEDGEVLPLAWRVGFLVGWLSALALTNDTLARYGVDVLTWYIRRERPHSVA